ncbi:TIGR04438 family Trp-rich protein [Massilia sp. CF038]|uniref:TIGR04438 family Trp-rich protein n=1 Tax=Massilia sp. CF038 TaxID=1881045 RepID=UPI00091EEC7B|nr:TIGR04438 family Trp-rich protein [Massilia sp. CF038]SHG41663.1 small Trp-rich protein [Massilia sp. CF038]
MPIILLILALGLLKYFEVWKFAEMSWWWCGGLMIVAFIWFEYIEKIFGLDKKKAHDEDRERREARRKATFDQQNRRK